MKGKDPQGSGEVVGIVIAAMPAQPRKTVFSAFIWGPAPAEDTEPKAA